MRLKKLGITLGAIATLLTGGKALADYVPIGKSDQYTYTLARDYNNDGRFVLSEVVFYENPRDPQNDLYFGTNNIFDADKEAERISKPNQKPAEIVRLKPERTDYKHVIKIPNADFAALQAVKDFKSGKIPVYNPDKGLEEKRLYDSLQAELKKSADDYKSNSSNENSERMFRINELASKAWGDYQDQKLLGQNIFHGIQDTLRYIIANRTSLDEMLDDLSRQDIVLIGENHYNPAHPITQARILRGIFARNQNVVYGSEGLNVGDEERIEEALAVPIFEQNKFLNDLGMWNVIVNKPESFKFIHQTGIKVLPTEANGSYYEVKLFDNEVRDILTAFQIDGARQLGYTPVCLMGSIHAQVDRVPKILREKGHRVKTVQLDFPQRVSEQAQQLFPGEFVIIRTLFGYHISHHKY